MRYYAGLDVSLAETSICIVDEEGKILREAKVASEPEALGRWLGDLGLPLTRVGLETGALAGWLCEEMTEARGAQCRLHGCPSRPSRDGRHDT